MNDLSGLKRRITLRLVLFAVIVFSLLFVPAGSFRFWEAWAYFVIFLSATVFLTVHFLKRDPWFIERRLQRKEKIKAQKSIQTANTVLSIVGFMMPGFDYRFNMSHVPINIVILADLMVLFGYLVIFLVFKENIYASSIIEVGKDQKVVTTGLYSLVRHPMYMGAIIMFLFTPLALGSYWALIPFLIMSLFIVIRLLNEEEFLLKELPGYQTYIEKTRYRLIPFVW